MIDLSHTAAIVLAAGRGSRMQAKSKNKVAFKLDGKPMIAHTVGHLLQAGIKEIIAVVGFQADSVRTALNNTVSYAVQPQQLGTGDAVKSALPLLSAKTTTILTISGDDSAFYPSSLYQEMVQKLWTSKADILFLTIHKDDPTGLGRIIRDANGKVTSIVEEKVATDAERHIQEINTGFYCFDREFLTTYIDQIRQNPISGEYYLTDLIEVAIRNGKTVEAFFVKDDSIWHGVNTRQDLVGAKKKLILK